MRYFFQLFMVLFLSINCISQNKKELRVMSLSGTDSVVEGRTTINTVKVFGKAKNKEDFSPPIMQGWPKTIGVNYYFAPSRGLLFVDLDGDARMEIIRPSTNGMVYIWRYNGTNFPGWPKRIGNYCQYAAAAADLDGDGYKEVLIPVRGITSGGGIYVYRYNGTAFPGWPKKYYVANSPCAADLDGDGRLEVIVLERKWPYGYVHVYRYNGTAFPGRWPYKLDHVPTGTPAVGDVDGDGIPEIVCMSYNSLYVFKPNGTLLSGFPYNVSQKHKANFSYQSPALADLDGDGKLEIAVCCHKTGSGCYVFKYNGKLLSGWPKLFGGTWSYSPPTIADINNDGKFEILAGRAGGGYTRPVLYAWDSSGKLISGFPVSRVGGAEGPIAVCDFDCDGMFEIFFDSNVMDSTTGKGWLSCVDAKGKIKPGFPIRVPGFTYMNGATVGDVDGDGKLELGVVSSTRSQGYVTLFKLPSTSSIPGKRLWKTYHEGNARRGLALESDRFLITGYAKTGSKINLEIYGNKGNLGIVLLGLGTGIYKTPYGIFRLSINRPVFVMHSTIFGSSGLSYVQYPIPASPVFKGIKLPMQGIEANITNYYIKLLQMQLIVIF